MESDQSTSPAKPEKKANEESGEISQYREILPQEMDCILAEHKKWVDSDGEEGKRANLRGVNLEHAFRGYCQVK